MAGYQATIRYDTSTLRYAGSSNGNFLPSGAFSVPPVISDNTITVAATSLSGATFGAGTLANLTFDIVAPKASTLTISKVLLTDSTGRISYARVETGQITEPPLPIGDLNGDGVVNVQDLTLVASNFAQEGDNLADVNGDGVVNIVDLTLVAAAMGESSGAPAIWIYNSENLPTIAEVQKWLQEAKQLALTDPTFLRGILVLEQLLAALTPQKTALLPNFPNPFNPETWIPYQLAEPADVTLSIHTAKGELIRTLALGNQAAGIYKNKDSAAYWDGKNESGELVASGIYFYSLTTKQYTATRKMLILK